MPPKEKAESPIKLAVAESDGLVKEIGVWMKEVKKEKSPTPEKIIEYREQQESFITRITELENKIEALKKEDEPSKVMFYDKTKNSALKKLQDNEKAIAAHLDKIDPPKNTEEGEKEEEKPPSKVSTPGVLKKVFGMKDKKKSVTVETDEDDEQSAEVEQEKKADEKNSSKKEVVKVKEEPKEEKNDTIKSEEVEEEKEEEPTKTKADKKKAEKRKEDKSAVVTNEVEEDEEDEEEKEEEKGKKQKDKSEKKKDKKSKSNEEEDSKPGKKDKNKKKEKEKKKNKKKGKEDADEDEEEEILDKKKDKKGDKDKKKEKSEDKKSVEKEEKAESKVDAKEKSKKKKEKETDEKEDKKDKDKVDDAPKVKVDKGAKSKTKTPEEDKASLSEKVESKLQTSEALTNEDATDEEDDYISEEETDIKKVQKPLSLSFKKPTTSPSPKTVQLAVAKSAPPPSKGVPVQNKAPEASEEEDYDEEADEDEETEDLVREFTVIRAFQAEQEGDLTISTGEKLTILNANSDGWWEARNSKNEEGFVPSNHLKVFEPDDPRKFSATAALKEVKRVQHEDDEEEDEEDYEEGDEEEEEDNYDEEAPDSENEDGLKTPKSPGVKPWEEIKKTMSQKSDEDKLKSFGSLPSGFRPSTLAKWANDDKKSILSFIVPKLSQSQLAFRDLCYDPAVNHLRPHVARFQRIFQISKVLQVHATEDNFKILTRHVRICLFDGNKAVSNVHTIQAICNEKDTKTWTFVNNKETDSTKYAECGDILIRFNQPDNQVSILVEVGMTAIRLEDQGKLDMSVGWITIPLYDESGQPTPNKSHEFILKGGTPFERGVKVDPNVAPKPDEVGLLKSLVHQDKQTKLMCKMANVSRDLTGCVDYLPDVILCNPGQVVFLSYFRQLMADALLKNNTSVDTIAPVHSPILVNFPKALRQPDLMDYLRIKWNEELRTNKALNKKDNESMRNAFKNVFMNFIYPALLMSDLPEYDTSKPDIMEKRHAKLQSFFLKSRSTPNVIDILMNSDIDFEPFSLDEVSYSINNPYCIAAPMPLEIS